MKYLITLINQGERVFIGKDVTIHLPRNLEKMTAKQTEIVIEYLAAQPLKDLRKWQSIISGQIEQVSTHYASRKPPGHYDAAIANLQIMERHLTDAVLTSQFSLSD